MGRKRKGKRGRKGTEYLHYEFNQSIILLPARPPSLPPSLPPTLLPPVKMEHTPYRDQVAREDDSVVCNIDSSDSGLTEHISTDYPVLLDLDHFTRKKRWRREVGGSVCRKL